MRKKWLLFVVLLPIFIFQNVYAEVVTPSTDVMYVLTTTRGNAILLKSEGRFVLVDIGDQGVSKKNQKCSNLYKEIKHYVKDAKLDYIILSHTHIDHTSCLNTILNGYEDSTGSYPGIPTDNLLVKYYYKSQDDSNSTSDVRDKYLNFRAYAKEANVNLYAIRSEKREAVTDNRFYLMDTNNNEVSPTKDMKFLNYKEDWNKSYLNLKVGNYNLYLFNLPQRFTASDNYNSLVVYGEVDGYKIYIGGDIENSRTTMTDGSVYTAYQDMDLYYYSKDKKRIFGTGTSRLADFYSQYIHDQFSKGKVNVYVAGHHGATNGTTTSVAKRLIKKGTKIVFTTAYEYLNAQYAYGDILRDDPRCAVEVDGSEMKGVRRHRCQNDKTVNRIIYALNKGKPTESSQVTIYHTSTTKVLRFGFNTEFSTGAKRIGIAGGYKEVYSYRDDIVR